MAPDNFRRRLQAECTRTSSSDYLYRVLMQPILPLNLTTHLGSLSELAPILLANDEECAGRGRSLALRTVTASLPDMMSSAEKVKLSELEKKPWPDYLGRRDSGFRCYQCWRSCQRSFNGSARYTSFRAPCEPMHFQLHPACPHGRSSYTRPALAGAV